MMQPNLIGALIEREIICIFCDCPTSEWDEIEIRGGTYKMCPECQIDYAEAISDARAKADAAGVAEDEAQEGE